MTFERAVFWSGIWNVGLGLILITPPIREFLGLQIPNPFWPCIVAVFLWYTAATLILSSRNVLVASRVGEASFSKHQLFIPRTDRLRARHAPR